MDWRSRSVIAWPLSNTMDAESCVAVLEEAVNRYGVSNIFNTDQGSQFTSLEFIQAPRDAGDGYAKDGKSCWMDNTCEQRIWRSVKWECLYLRKMETGSQARKILRDWFQFYNDQRPHTAFDCRRLVEVYYEGIRPQSGIRQIGLELNNVANLSKNRTTSESTYYTGWYNYDPSFKTHRNHPFRFLLAGHSGVDKHF